MCSWYDLLKDLVVPGVTGLGAVAVGIASLRVARASNELATSISQREHQRLQRLDREAFGEKVRAYAAVQRRVRLVGFAQLTTTEKESSRLLHARSDLTGLPGADLLVRAVDRQMNEPWVTNDKDEGALDAYLESNAIIDMWVGNPDRFIASEESRPSYPPGP